MEIATTQIAVDRVLRNQPVHRRHGFKTQLPQIPSALAPHPPLQPALVYPLLGDALFNLRGPTVALALLLIGVMLVISWRALKSGQALVREQDG